ncbi:hypothetical protein tinsulaeT_18040 [Thalassotalea insulae]|uniref:Uncharacterized protein n=1 Tax=Thalassotalea insulae TaxID=2056778 RepID=A0ABQ6GS58_9GAMM|nr:hypothetical protein tinsulaeT_18040 [Thalassotalea insulae]
MISTRINARVNASLIILTNDLKSTFLLLLALCFNSNASQIINEGYISLVIPHLDCEKRCLKVSVTKERKPYIEQKISHQDAFTLSGLSDGNYQVTYYPSKGSQTAITNEFTVQHHALTKALTVFIIGAILFCALILRLLKIKQEE